MKRVSAILLCAGKGTRAKALKPLLTWKSETFLSKVYRSLQETKMIDEIMVVTGHESQALEGELLRLKARSVFNPFYERGMHASICEGLRALSPGWDGALIALVDQPQLESQDYKTVVEAFRNSSLTLARPEFGGRIGNPSIVGRRYYLEVMAETDADRGCSYLFKRHPSEVLTVNMPTESCLVDIDTPEKLREMTV